MLLLNKDLQLKIATIKEFGEVAIRILNYLPNISSAFEEKGNYIIYSSVIAVLKNVRPINKTFFINDALLFSEKMEGFVIILTKIKNKICFSQKTKSIQSIVFYIQSNSQ